MKFTLSWLKEHLETTATVDEISVALTNLGLLVDTITNPADDLRDFVVAKITDAQKHPNADKLQVCTVSTGSETLKVVCGGANARAGITVVLAKPGTVIPSNGMTIKAAKVRDVESNGMLCAASELCLEETSNGIMELEADAPLGESYPTYANLDDPIFTIEITPNRGDALGIRGIARDLAAAGIGKLITHAVPEIKGTGKSEITVAQNLSKDTLDACPFFAGRMIRGVKNGPSPAWLQARLRALGMRPISKLVDVTNYITFAYGRPLHVFDQNKIHGDTLEISLAKGGESFGGLDEKDYTLKEGMTIIRDADRVVSLGGILGGSNTGCDEGTVDVFLEAAIFDPIRTTMTGRDLGVITDARYRFERGTDPEIIVEGVERGTQMILDLCGGEPSELTLTGAVPKRTQVVDLDPARVKTLGGISASADKVKEILTDLGFSVSEKAGIFSVTVPSWRNDIDGSADLVEEVCRVIGYDNIEEESLPQTSALEQAQSTSGAVCLKRAKIAKRVLASRGLCECQTWSFLDAKKAHLFGGGEDSMKIVNPISQDLEIMRPSLLPNLIAGTGRNHDRGLHNTALFELGAVYNSTLPDNQKICVAGVRNQKYTERHWLSPERAVDAFDAKADVLAILESYGLKADQLQIKSDNLPAYMHPGRAGAIYLGPKNCLGVFGEIHPKILKEMDVEGPIVAFELDLGSLPPAKNQAKKKGLTLSNLQPIHRDFAFLLDQQVQVDKLLHSAKKVDRTLITDANVFDVYDGKGVPEGKKSVALTVTFQPHEKTLTDDEINHLMDKIIASISKDTGGELRS